MPVPRLLGERYQIGDTLGFGGMAEVHRGVDTRLGRDVAVKMLRPDMARDPLFQARFRREAQHAAALNHPSIVAVYDTGEEPAADGVALPYIVMEYVEGRTLRQVLEAEGKLMPQRAMEIAADVCSALEFSHRGGIVHRDMKPANVMLTPTGQVKVMDFGIARAVAQGSAAMTQTSAVMGTVQYLAPEQARGEEVDARADIYSTGCLLYELLVGAPPFTGDSPVSVAYQHVREDPTPPSEINPDVSPAADAIVLKAMAKNPANRYQSAGEMRADLLRAIAGRPVEATPVFTHAERTQVFQPLRPAATATVLREPPPPSRRGGWYLLLALAVLGLFVLAALITRYAINSNKAAATISVPDEHGKTQAAAVADLKLNGLSSRIVEVFRDDASRGKVVDQDPVAGIQAVKNSVVALTVDQGLRRVPVPVLVGTTRDQATSQLGGLGLKPVVTVVSSDKPLNEVVGTNPPAGTSVPVGGKVTVQVSNGSVHVPNVVSQTQADASATLRAVDFTVRVVLRITTSAPEGTVVEQSPKADKLAVKGSAVTIVVARAPAPSPSPTPPAPPPSVPPTFAPSPSPLPSPSPSPSLPSPSPSSSP